MRFRLLTAMVLFLPSLSFAFDASACFRDNSSQKELREVVSYLKDARLDGEGYEVLLQCYFRLEEHEAMLGLIDSEELRLQYGGYSFFPYYAGLASYGLGQYERAAAEFESSIRLGGYGEEDAAYLARSYHAVGDPEKAVSILRDYMEWLTASTPDPAAGVYRISESEVDTAVQLSGYLAQANDIASARDVLSVAARRNSGSRKIHENLLAFLKVHGPAELYEIQKNRKQVFLDHIER